MALNFSKPTISLVGGCVLTSARIFSSGYHHQTQWFTPYTYNIANNTMLILFQNLTTTNSDQTTKLKTNPETIAILIFLILLLLTIGFGGTNLIDRLHISFLKIFHPQKLLQQQQITHQKQIISLKYTKFHTDIESVV